MPAPASAAQDCSHCRTDPLPTRPCDPRVRHDGQRRYAGCAAISDAFSRSRYWWIRVLSTPGSISASARCHNPAHSDSCPARRRAPAARRRYAGPGHQRQREAAGVAARHDELAQLGLGGDVATAGRIEHVGEDVQVQTHAARDQQRLAGRQQTGGVHIVVQRLHGMGRADRAGGDQRGAHARQQRTRALQVGGIAARHDGQRRRRPCHGAGYRRVDQRQSGRAQQRRQPQRLRGIGRAHVQQQGTGPQQRHQAWTAPRALDHGIGHGAVGQHGDDDVAAGQLVQAPGPRSVRPQAGCACSRARRAGSRSWARIRSSVSARARFSSIGKPIIPSPTNPISCPCLPLIDDAFPERKAHGDATGCSFRGLC